MKYSINSECGHMVVEADSIEAAKEAYEQKHHFDFAAEIAGSWYTISDDSTGEELEARRSEVD